MKRYKFTIPKPKTSEQELEKLDWESKLATYGNNIKVESLFANTFVNYELDIDPDELNMDEFVKFTKQLYRK